MKGVLRAFLVLTCLLLIFAVLAVCFARGQEPAPPPPAPATYGITGFAKNGKVPLPGVTVTATNTLTGKKFAVATSLDGSFTLANLPRGRYVVKFEFMGFANLTQEVVLNPQNPAGKVEAELILASRQQEETARTTSAAAATRGFQNLAAEGSLAAIGGQSAATGMPTSADLSSLPMNGAGADVSTESVSVTGAQGRSQDFGFGNEDELQQRVQEYRDRAMASGGGFGSFVGGPGGPGGGGPMGGGPGGPMMIGGRGGRFNLNQPHGFLYFQDDNSGLDARPYSLSGQQSDKASYNTIRFGAMVGGPLKIPHLFDWSKTTFFTFGWNGTRGSTPFDQFSTVPTAAERQGIFTGLTDQNGQPVTIYDPYTGQPFANNVINPALFSAAAQALLAYIPAPNLPTQTQNFHYVTSDNGETDAISFRIIHNFAPTSGGGPGGFGPPPGMGGGGRRSSGPRNNLNFGLNISRSSNELVNSFPSLTGHSSGQGLNASVRWLYGKGRITNTVGFTYNRSTASTTNAFTNVYDVSGDAGITGISNDPFNWGLPGIDFNTYSGLSNPIASKETDQTFSLTDVASWNHGKHNVRFGGDFRWIFQDFRSARNSQGTFVFTGFATSAYAPGSTEPLANTGNDFADFLLGLPQQTSLQSGTSSYSFRANAFDFFVQDDWRISANLSINAGLRYEYNGPYSEAQNHIVNLDVSSGFANAVPVYPNTFGPYSGYFPDSLVRADRNNWAPRIGIAWKPIKNTVVRAGYGINYNLAQYGAFVRNFSYQPPFAVTSTNVSSLADPLTLENGFPGAVAGTVTNNFAVNPNYRLPSVQIWNLDIQRQLPLGIQLNVGYNGAKGTDLDSQLALVAGGQPFIYETSESNSILNAGSVRIRKRMAKGLGVSAVYIFSKSIDDASSIGGGSVVVVQNPYDIPAERAISPFSQKHRFTGNWIYDLPFGDGRRFLTNGWISHAVGGWQWSGDFTIASGFYYTPNVLGASTDINRGVSGSLRANRIPGASLSVANPTTAEWFNTSAFCAPSATCVNSSGSQYGDAGRDIILGPSQFTFDMAINRTFTIKESRTLDFRLQANNIFNTPYFSTINTTVNSLSFGQVTGVANMRRITMIVRFRF